MKPLRALVVFIFLIAPAGRAAAETAALVRASGVVEIRRAGATDWILPDHLPAPLFPDDSVRAGRGAAAVIDVARPGRSGRGARLRLRGPGELALTGAAGFAVAAELRLGRLEVSVDVDSRRVKVLAGAASCWAAGAQFSVEARDGRAALEVKRGLLAVEDARGSGELLKAGQRMVVDNRGLAAPAAAPEAAPRRLDVFRQRMRQELDSDAERVAVEEAVARSARLSQLMAGDALVNAEGDRVRVESYVLRPAPDEFELVTLNGSRENGLSYFSYLGTLNTTVPAELAPVLQQLSGTAGVEPTWYLTAYTAVESNFVDSVVQRAAGGHPVDVNHNGDPSDDVTELYNAGTDQWENVAGLPVYVTLFDREGLYVDGVLKSGWTGTNLQQYSDALPSDVSGVDPFTGAAVTVPTLTASESFPTGNMERVTYDSFSDGTFLSIDQSQLTTGSQVATMAQFGAAASGQPYQQGALSFGFEENISASEFGGRTINLLLSPKQLLETGLLAP